MNKMARFLLALMVAVLVGLEAMPARAAANPQFDITGVWKNSIGQTLQVFQAKDQVTVILVNSGWAHLMEGRYVSPTHAKLLLIRRTRPAVCEMTMTVDITANSANSLTLTSVAAETACGLTSGQNFPDSFTRVL
jgi:hypothetical protein